ncbi:MAG: TolC family outer membrane protein [Pseudomonadota bacterium]
MQFKSLLLAGVASLAFSPVAIAMADMAAEVATSPSLVDKPITGRLNTAPPSSLKAPATLGAVGAVVPDAGMDQDDSDAGLAVIGDIDSDAIPSRLQPTNPTGHNRAAAPGALDFVPAPKPVITNTASMDQAYDAAAAMAAELADTTDRLTAAVTGKQLATLPGDAGDNEVTGTSETGNIETGNTEAEITETEISDTLIRDTVDQVAGLPAADQELMTQAVAVVPVTAEALDASNAPDAEAKDGDAHDDGQVVEIFSGDLPVRQRVIELPPLPAAKPPVEIRSTPEVEPTTAPKADASALMQNSVADNGGTSVEELLGSFDRDDFKTADEENGFATVRATQNGNLKQIIALAIQNHPQVLGSKAEMRASEEAVREERSDLFPTLSVEAFSGYRNTDNRTTRARPTRGAGGDGDLSAWASEGTLRMRQLLFDFGATPNTIDAAQSRLGESQFLEADSQEQIGLRAVDAYLSVLQADANRGFAQRNVDFHLQTLDDVSQRAEAGAGDDGDVRQTESRLALAREFLLGFDEALEIAKADFIEAVGNAPGQLDPVEVPSDPMPTDVADALAIAIEENPFIAAASFAAHGLEHDAEAAEGAFYPRFDLDVSYTRGDDVSGLGGRDEETRALVRMVWDIPVGGGEYATRRRLQNLQEAAEQEQEERIRLIEEEVRASFAEVEITREQVTQLGIRSEAADGVVDAYLQQFGVGRRTLLDLLDSENERFLARVALNNGETDLIRAHYRLFTAMGRLRQVLGLPSALAESPLRESN